MKLKGIDVSKWQGDSIDFAAVKADGYDFVMIRSSLGSYTKDPYFERNYTAAKDAGLLVGAYHYFYSNTEAMAREEAAFFIDQLAGKVFEMPVAIDVEEKTIFERGAEAANEAVTAFCNHLESRGYYIAVYASEGSVFNAILNEDVKTRFDKWVANWSAKPQISGAGMWQYTSEGTVAGIAGRVDLNEAYKDYPAIMQRAGLNGFKNLPPDPVKPEPQPEPGTIKIGDKVKINGAYAAGAYAAAWYKTAIGAERTVTAIYKDAPNPYQLGIIAGDTSGNNTTGFAPANSIVKL